MAHAPRTTCAAVAAALLVLAGCGGDGDGDGDDGGAPATATAPGGPAPSLEPLPPEPGHGAVGNPSAGAVGPGIEEVTAPSTVACEAGGRVDVPVSWEAPTAVAVRLLVDGEVVGGEQPPTGSADVALACDGAAHVVVVAALGEDDEPSVASVAVLTEPAG